MGALEAILALREESNRRDEAQANAISQGFTGFVDSFIKGRELQKSKNKDLIDELTLKVAAAKSGFDIDMMTGELKVNPEFQSNATQPVFTVDNEGNLKLTTGATGGYIPKGGKVFKEALAPEEIASREEAKFGASKETAKRAFDLRQEFQNTETVKDFQVIRNQVTAMDALVDKIDTDKQSALALDQGLITLFNKVTDPQSVVRESEYERTPENLSLVNRFQGAYGKLAKGGAGLTNTDRKALVFGAKVIADSRGNIYNDVLSNYENLSEEFGVKPKLVTSGYGKHKNFLSIKNGGDDSSLLNRLGLDHNKFEIVRE